MAGQEESLNKGQIEDSEVQTRNRQKSSSQDDLTNQDVSEPDIFRTPMVLINNDSGKPECNHETIAALSKIERTLNIVSVVGSLRTGKSFILNAVANNESLGSAGFTTGRSSVSLTKGIWVLCRPHPTQEEQVLVLLDTEGTDDPRKVKLLDECVFLLTTLLSGTLVYNIIGNFNKAAIDKFEFLDGLKASVTVAGTDMDDSILDFFFPTFIVLLRDFHLEVSEGSDQYLENAIKLEMGTDDDTVKYNRPRELVRRYFKKRKCFVLGFPTTTTKMPELLNMSEDELDDGFKKQLNAFRNYVFTCGPKTLKSGKGINGRMFCTLLKCYVNAVKEKQAPNIQAAMKTMSDVENTRTINEAAAIYETKMKQKIDTNGDQNDSDLDTLHRDCMDAAFAVLKSGLVFDDEQIYEERAISQIGTLLERFKSLVEKKSKATYKEKLQQLNKRIERKMKIGAYRHYSGYDEYMTDIDWVIGRYYREYKFLPKHGGDTVQEFLDGKESEELIVYQWVVEAQAQEKQRVSTVKTSIPPSKRQPNDLRACDEQIPREGTDTLEIRLSKNVEYVQASGMKNIANSYLEMIKMKQNELERVKCELSAENPAVKQLHQEIEYWEKFGKSATWNQSKYKHDGPSERGVSEPYQKKNITVKMAESMKKLEEIYSKKHLFPKPDETPADSQVYVGKDDNENKTSRCTIC